MESGIGGSAIKTVEKIEFEDSSLLGSDMPVNIVHCGMVTFQYSFGACVFESAKWAVGKCVKT